MKYVEEMICFQEVPDEISLSFSISNCPRKCIGCHSTYLSEDIGNQILDVLEDRIEQYLGYITCVLFLGGDDPLQKQDLIQCLNICKQKNLKTALYSGGDEIDTDLLPILNYYKIGHFDKQFGPLNNKNTNQRMYEILSDLSLKDITYKFQNKIK